MRSFPVKVFDPRLLRALCLSMFAVVAAASCTTAKDTESYVPSKVGVVQPEPNGQLVDEASACAQFTKAEAKARADLSCDAVKRTCPAFIRPAGGEGCFQYDQGTINGCVKLFGTFTTCDDFDANPCVLSAKSSCDQGAGEGGAAGAGGAAGGNEGGVGGMMVVPPADAGAGG
jgi:hypothetical protein